MATQVRFLSAFPSGLDLNQFLESVQGDVTLPAVLQCFMEGDPNSPGTATITMIFATALDAGQVTQYNTLITNHVPSQGGYPAYQPTPNDTNTLTGTAEFVWTSNTGSNIMVLNGDVIQMNESIEVMKISPDQVPPVSAADKAILYVDSVSGVLTQVEFGGASGPVGGGGGTNLQLANTGVGAHIYAATNGNTGYFRGITGVNAHTIVTEGPSSVSIQVPFSSTSQTGAIRIATNTEVNAGVANNLAVSPTGLAQWTLSTNTIPRYQTSATDAIANFSSTTYVVITGMTITTPLAGTYMITFSTSASASTNNNSLFVALFIGGTVITASERESANNKPVVVATQAIAQVNGAQNIEARWRVNGNAASIAGPRILSALRIGP